MKKDYYDAVKAANFYAENFFDICSAKLPFREDYDADLYLYLENYGTRKVEIKTSKYPLFRADGTLQKWYYAAATPTQQYIFTPTTAQTFDYIAANYHCSGCTGMATGTTIPVELEGKNLYCDISASNSAGRCATSDTKARKMLESNAELLVIFKDGFLRFSPKQFKDAFCGYRWQFCNYTHDADAAIYHAGEKWQLRACLDISKGTFFPNNTKLERKLCIDE